MFVQWEVEFSAELGASTGVRVDVRTLRGMSAWQPGADGFRDWVVLSPPDFRLDRPVEVAPPLRSRYAESVGLLRPVADAIDVGAASEHVRRLAAEVHAWLPDDTYEITSYLQWRVGAVATGDIAAEAVRVDRGSTLITVTARHRATGAVGKAGIADRRALPDVPVDEVRAVFDRAVAQAARLAPGAPLEGTPHTVVMGPHAASTFLHEVIGHAHEADNAAIAGIRHGERLSGAALTVVDGPHQERGWAGAVRDDEGVPTSKVVLLRDGVVAGYLHDAGSAERTGAPPNGHGRRETFDTPPFPRLTQIAPCAGADDPEAMLATVADGLYVTAFGYGYLSPRTGAARLVIREARRIRDGRLTSDIVNGGELRLDARTALAAIDGVGPDLGWFPTVCFKRKQELPVLNGGVTLLLRGITGESRPDHADPARAVLGDHPVRQASANGEGG